MGLKSINVALVVDERELPQALLDFAIALAERNAAHLDLSLMVNQLDLPTSRVLPLVDAIQDEVNRERLSKAENLVERFSASARLAGVSFEPRVMTSGLPEVRDEIVGHGRTSDVVLLSKPETYLSIEMALIEGCLFASGRPVIVVPESWRRHDAPKRVAVGWNGSSRAARAIADAMPFLEAAEAVDVVCAAASPDAALGSDIAAHLARHVARVSVTPLPVGFQSDGEVIRNHLGLTKPDLFVMGAFGHSRFFEFVLGGVTRTMLYEAPVPVLYSF